MLPNLGQLHEGRSHIFTPLTTLSEAIEWEKKRLFSILLSLSFFLRQNGNWEDKMHFFYCEWPIKIYNF